MAGRLFDFGSFKLYELSNDIYTMFRIHAVRFELVSGKTLVLDISLFNCS
jgi:hypothetical protein